MANLKERRAYHLELTLWRAPRTWLRKPVPHCRYSCGSGTRFFQLASLEGSSLLAIEAEDRESRIAVANTGSIEEALKLKLGEPVVLVLPILPSYARNQMVQMGIPFVVPGSQTFIPNSVLDLRERFPQPDPKRRETLSPAAQCTVLHQLLRGTLAGISLKDIARKVHYSPMMMTKVKQELEAGEICKVVQSGRSMVLDFKATGRALWEQVKPQLTSPVKRTRWVQWAKPMEPASLAGMSALSLRTMIAADRLPTYALPLAVFRDFRGARRLRRLPRCGERNGEN